MKFELQKVSQRKSLPKQVKIWVKKYLYPYPHIIVAKYPLEKLCILTGYQKTNAYRIDHLRPSNVHLLDQEEDSTVLLFQNSTGVVTLSFNSSFFFDDDMKTIRSFNNPRGNAAFYTVEMPPDETT